jgi:hypothetical protein
MNVKRWLGVGCSLVLALGVVMAADPTAHAGTGTACAEIPYPNWPTCDGTEPSQSYNIKTGLECSTGASTVFEEPAFGGILELRWGPNCQTNWARFNPANNHMYGMWVTRLSDGVWAGSGINLPGSGVYWEYYFVGTPGVQAWTDQIYSPGPASMCIDDITAGGRVCYFQKS